MNYSNILPRHTSYELPIAAYGDGCYIIDNNGKILKSDFPFEEADPSGIFHALTL